MEQRFKERKAELMADCETDPEVLRGVAQRLEVFAGPFLATMEVELDRRDGGLYLAGLLSD